MPLRATTQVQAGDERRKTEQPGKGRGQRVQARQRQRLARKYHLPEVAVIEQVQVHQREQRGHRQQPGAQTCGQSGQQHSAQDQGPARWQVPGQLLERHAACPCRSYGVMDARTSAP